MEGILLSSGSADRRLRGGFRSWEPDFFPVYSKKAAHLLMISLLLTCPIWAYLRGRRSKLGGFFVFRGRRSKIEDGGCSRFFGARRSKMRGPFIFRGQDGRSVGGGSSQMERVFFEFG